MRSARATKGLVLAGVLGVAGLGVGATLDPAVASTVSTGTHTVTGRITAITNALSGLVKNGTLTQAQADKVATTLNNTLPKGGFGHGLGGRFGRGAELDTAASVIGVTSDQLRTALESGKTLAQVAHSKGVSQATLVDRLAAAAKTRITAAVKAGRLTQAQATTVTGNLTNRITAQVTSTRPPGGRGHWEGHWGRNGTTTPSSIPNANPSTTS